MAQDYRIVEKGGMFEPQMLYGCGAAPGMKWFPLNKNGYWADPSAYDFGLITKDSLMSLEEAKCAIESAKKINGLEPGMQP